METCQICRRSLKGWNIYNKNTHAISCAKKNTHIGARAEFTKCDPKNAREHFDESCQKSHKCSRAFSYLEEKVMNARENFPIWKKKS